MKRTIKKLSNGDFQVEPDNTIVYGIRKYINEERTMREKLKPIHRTNKDPNITIIDDIILSAHHRIALYQTLQEGLWNTIFGTDNTNEIARERELIEEFKRMKQEIIEWQTKNTIPPYSK